MGIIELRKICKTYDTGATKVHALKPTDLDIAEGSFIAIMGPSGSGKSTMLNLLGMLDQPTSGEFWLDGQNVASMNDDSISEIRCRKVGFIFQSFNLFSGYSILENVCVPMRYSDMPEKEAYDRAASLLELVGLGDRMTHKPTELSGGQCQRVAIARSMANNPAFLLADEPTGNLDEKTGIEILGLFHDLHAKGHTIIMVTHNPEYENEVERVVVLHDGNVTRDETMNNHRFGNRD